MSKRAKVLEANLAVDQDERTVINIKVFEVMQTQSFYNACDSHDKAVFRHMKIQVGCSHSWQSLCVDRP